MKVIAHNRIKLNLTLKGQELELVESFNCHCGILDQSGKCDKEID